MKNINISIPARLVILGIIAITLFIIGLHQADAKTLVSACYSQTTVNQLNTQIADLKLQVDKLKSDNTVLVSFNSNLILQLMENNKIRIVKTKTQLIAEYLTNNPKVVCKAKPNEPTNVFSSRCSKESATYSTELNKWVNYQLSNQ